MLKILGLLKICLIFNLFPLLCFAGNALPESKREYTVQHGDTLSHVLQALGFTPLWGKKGYVQKAFQLNKELLQRGPDAIYPGSVLYLPGVKVIFVSSPNKPEAAAKRQMILVRKSASEEAEIAVAPTAKEAPLTQLKSSNGNSAEKESSFDSQIVFSLGSGYSRIDSKNSGNGSQATLLSKPISEIGLRWEQFWSEEMHSFIAWNYRKFSFRPANVGVLNNDSMDGTSLMFGGNYRFQSKWKIEISAGMKDFYFVPSYQAGTATLESKNLMLIQSSLWRELLKRRSLTLDAGLGGSFLGGSSDGSYSVKEGQSYLIGLKVTQQFLRYSLSAIIDYEGFSQNGSQFSTNRKDIFGRMQLGWFL